MDKARLQFYSDGVFVIAATLLVLTFTVPVIKDGVNAELAAKLLALWPRFLIYVLSFAVIGNVWRLHNAVFNGAERIDHTTILINLGILVITAFIPFVTAVAGTYPTLPAAAVLYSATLLVVNVDGYWLVLHLRRIGAYGEPPPPSVEAAMRRIRHGMAIRVVGLVAAFFLPVVSYAIFLIGTLYYMLVGDIDTPKSPPNPLESPPSISS
jgi:uncharacterized membrane protein